MHIAFVITEVIRIEYQRHNLWPGKLLASFISAASTRRLSLQSQHSLTLKLAQPSAVVFSTLDLRVLHGL